ncbi:helix-turn-helix domain-containing protein [Gymnodinialimonas mytili]|uniref:helix-turn-helix domain-containing protein n=1 Tax=Gymnodinialimonas mytili TaxID=3126503 RepID=UPI0030ECAFD6
MIERRLDLDTEQAFVRIAELGSFTRAAEATETTQSAISLKLKRLEKRLDCRLVERTPRHVQLSAQGRLFSITQSSFWQHKIVRWPPCPHRGRD